MTKKLPTREEKVFDVYCEVYGTNLLVLSGFSPEKVRPYLEKKYKIKWEYGEDSLKGGAILDFPKWPYHVLWLKKGLPKVDVIPKLSHEVFHHVLTLCGEKGIPTYSKIDNLQMDEAAAYLMEFYMREILKKLKTQP